MDIYVDEVEKLLKTLWKGQAKIHVPGGKTTQLSF